MDEEDTLVQRVARLRGARRRGRACLVVLSGREVGAVYRLSLGESIIGRGTDADIQIIDDGVSRRHAKVVRDEDGTSKLIDLGSTNGTYLNGRRIDVESLREGDRIRIGQSATLDFRYEYEHETRDPPRVAPSPATASKVQTRPHAFDNLAATLDSLGRVYETNKQYDQALATYRRTLAIREEALGADHPGVAAILDTMSSVLRAKGDLEEALAAQRRAVQIYEVRVRDGTPPPEMAHLLVNMAECQHELGAHEEALRSAERALEMLEMREAEDSELAAARFAVARILRALDRTPARARALAVLARQGFAQTAGGRHKVLAVDRWLAETER